MYGYFYDKDLKQVFINANDTRTEREITDGAIHLVWHVPLEFKTTGNSAIATFDLTTGSGSLTLTLEDKSYLMNAKDIQKKWFKQEVLDEISKDYQITPVSVRAILRYIVNTMTEQYIDESPESLFSYNTRTVSDSWEPSRSPYEGLPMDWWETL